MIQFLHAFIRKQSRTIAALCALALAIAAPYLIPTDPDSIVFRNGTLAFVLILATYLPVRDALQRHSLRTLCYGWCSGLVFCFFLGLGSEIAFYDQLLPGLSSLIRRFAVPVLAAPAVGTLFSFVFSFPGKVCKKNRFTIPWVIFFLLFALWYGAALLAFFPGIINYDFDREIAQYLTGNYQAMHPIFHTWLTGVLYSLGHALFGSMTAGAAVYSAFQLLCLAAMFATVCSFVQRRVPMWCTLLLTACFLLPFHSIIAISTVKDAFFCGLCTLLCIQLWFIAQKPDEFLASRKHKLGFVLLCILLALIRHNGIFAYLPAILAVFILCRHQRRNALFLCALTLTLSLFAPKGAEWITDAESFPNSEMLSIPCQQMMRTANRAELTEEEFADLERWFPGATHTYRPYSADPAKGGNFNFALYQNDPMDYWKTWGTYALKYPRIYIEAFLFNCMGLWYPDDLSHAHALDSEDWDLVYLKTGNIVPEIVGEIHAHSYLPKVRNMLFNIAHRSSHEQTPVFSLLFRPATYVYLLLLLTLYACCRKRGRYICALLPIWGVFISLIFSACILVRYAYPLMTIMPIMILLTLFTNRQSK